MKQLSILVISVILFSCSESEIRYHIDEVSFPNDTLTYLKSDMTLINGVVYSEFGELGKFINGEREGRHKRWYENGQLTNEGEYSEGNLIGPYKIYYQNGQLKEEGLHNQYGKAEGLSKAWYENGQLMRQLAFKDGELHGYAKQWYENGQLEVEGGYLFGKRIGKFITYDETGEIKFEKFFD